jgi:hypothetical protein
VSELLTADVVARFAAHGVALGLSVERNAADAIYEHPVAVYPAQILLETTQWQLTRNPISDFATGSSTRAQPQDAFASGIGSWKNWLWATDPKDVLRTFSNGVVVLRVYGPTELPVSVFSTGYVDDPAILLLTNQLTGGGQGGPGYYNARGLPEAAFLRAAADPLNARAILQGASVVGPAFFDKYLATHTLPENVFYYGERSATVTEAVKFSNQAVAATKYPYGTLGAVLYTSRFLNQAGQVVAAPKPTAQAPCVFEAASAVTGALMVQYTYKYRLYGVAYGVGPRNTQAFEDFRLRWLAAGAGTLPEPRLPQASAIVLWRDHVEVVDFEQPVSPSRALSVSFESRPMGPQSGALGGLSLPEPPNGADAAQTPKVLTEVSRKFVLESVKDRNNPENAVTVERTTEIKFQAQSGQPWTLRFKDPAKA